MGGYQSGFGALEALVVTLVGVAGKRRWGFGALVIQNAQVYPSTLESRVLANGRGECSNTDLQPK
jgi:hypothetical protein